MGFEEGFKTTWGIILALLLIPIGYYIIVYLSKFARWIFPHIKVFAIAHPIWSVVIGIVLLSIIGATLETCS